MIRGLAAALCLLAANAAAPAMADERLVVGASIRPMELALRAVGGDALSVRTVLGARSDPHATELTPSTIRDVTGSRVIFSYAHVEINERLSGLDVPLRIIGSGEPPHQWLDIDAQKRDLDELAGALCGLRPDLCGEFRAGSSRVARSLDTLGESCRAELAPFADVFVAATHPAWETFLRRTGLTRTGTLLTKRDESLVPSSVGKLLARRGETKRMIFIADPDTPEGVRSLVKTDLSAEVVVLDESGLDAPSLEGFYERLCRNLASALAR